MSKTKELAKNTAIIAVGKIATQFLTFLLLPLYTFLLEPAEYGKVDLVIVYAALLAPLATLQIERAAFRHLIDARSDPTESARIITNATAVIWLGGLGTACLLVIANIFYSIPFIWLAIGVFIALIWANLLQQIARGLGNNKAFSIGSIITGVTQVVMVLTLVWLLRLGGAGILAATIIANLAGILYFSASLKLRSHTKLSLISRKQLKRQLAYSLPLIPSNIAWWGISVSDRTIIALILGVAANGVYALAVKLASIFSILYAIYDMSWTESISMHINAKDRDTFVSRTMNQSLRFFGALGMLLITFIGAAFSFIVGDGFSDAYNYVPILVLGALFNAIVAQYSAIYIAKKQTKKVAASSISSAILNLLITIIGIRYIGIYAAAIATVVAFFVMAIYRHFDAQKYARVIYDMRTILLFALAYVIIFVGYYQHSTFLNIVLFSAAIGLAAFMNMQLLRSALHAIRQRKFMRKRI